MDHIKILKRAFEITRQYRILWIFGILLALTTGWGGGSSPNFRVPLQPSGNWTEGFQNPETFRLPENLWVPLQEIFGQILTVIVALCAALACFFFVWLVVATILRYVAETALIRMVDNHEASGEKAGFRQGWRLGWSRQAFSIFLIDLLVAIAVTVVFIILFSLSAAPLLVWLSRNTGLRIVGTVASFGIGLLVVILAIFVGFIISLLLPLIRRACILEHLGMFAAMRRGFILARKRFLDVVIIALMLFALGIGYVIVLIPIIVALSMAALLIAGLPSLAVGAMAGMFVEGATPWILAALVGIPLLILVFAIPLTFLNGLAATFVSSTWTLTYREIAELEPQQVEES